MGQPPLWSSHPGIINFSPLTNPLILARDSLVSPVWNVQGRTKKKTFTLKHSSFLKNCADSVICRKPAPFRTTTLPTTKERLQNNSIQIFSWNARSLNSVPKKLFLLLKSQDILCVQETWGSNLSDPPLSVPSFISRSARDQERGGGSLTVFRTPYKIHREVSINKDTKLVRILLHDNKILWMCNCYLNRGSKHQIQMLFKNLRNEIPKREWDRVVIVGDLNVDLLKRDDPRTRLLYTLSKELGLKILEPENPTCQNSKLDIAIISKDLMASITSEKFTLSDHTPIILQVETKIVNKNWDRVLLPNRKLAEDLTIFFLSHAIDTSSWIKSFDHFLNKFINKNMKRIKRRDYENRLLKNSLETKMLQFSKPFKSTGTILFQKMRSSDSALNQVKLLNNCQISLDIKTFKEEMEASLIALLMMER